MFTFVFPAQGMERKRRGCCRLMFCKPSRAFSSTAEVFGNFSPTLMPSGTADTVSEIICFSVRVPPSLQQGRRWFAPSAGCPALHCGTCLFLLSLIQVTFCVLYAHSVLCTSFYTIPAFCCQQFFTLKFFIVFCSFPFLCKFPSFTPLFYQQTAEIKANRVVA